jgi:predicted permease
VWIDLVTDGLAATRALAKRPGAALTVIATLALGTAINAAVFAVVHAALFGGFAQVDRSDRIVRIGTTRGFVYYPDIQVWRARATSFEDIALVRGVFHTLGAGSSAPQTYFTMEVTANTFRLLHVRPLLGRDFVSADEQPGSQPVVMLRYEFWVRAFGASPDVVGRIVTLDGQPARIIGVMPRGFTFPSTQDVWMPMVPTPAALERLTGYAQFAYARLRDGVTAQRAREDMDAIGRGLANELPRTHRGMTPVVEAFESWFVGAHERALYEMVWAAAAFVLLVICANLATLMMERAAARSHEIAIRLALGATYVRVTRPFIAEALMLSMTGAVLGWPLGYVALTLYEKASGAPTGPLNVVMNGSVFAFVWPVELAAGVLGSIGAAFYSVRLNINRALTSRSAVAPEQKRVPDVFVAAQVSLAVVLLMATGVLLRSYHTLATTDVGADTSNVVTMSLYTPLDRYGSADARRAFYAEVAERLSGLAGVAAVGFGTAAPTEFTPQANYAIDGDGPVDSTSRSPVAEFVAGPTYFQALRVAVIAGRVFNDTDRATTAPVAVVNQQFASRYWPGGTAIGKRIHRTLAAQDPAPWLTVVGVVGNVIQNDRTRRRFEPIVYVPYAQHSQANMFAFVRSGNDPEQLLNGVRRQLYDIDPNLPVPVLGTLDARFARTYAVERQSSVVVLGFAAVTLLIAILGMHAAVSRSVGSRVKEIAIRRAIGATTLDIAAVVSTRVACVVGIGWMSGIVLSVVLFRVGRTLTSDMSMAEPVVVLAMTAVLVLSAFVSCGLPVIRGTRIDPAVALRCN